MTDTPIKDAVAWMLFIPIALLILIFLSPNIFFPAHSTVLEDDLFLY